MSDTHRRSFLKSTLAGLASTAAVSRADRVKAAAANTLRFALIGCGGRGRSVAGEFAQLADIQLAYACDPDTSRAGDVAALFSGWRGDEEMFRAAREPYLLYR